MLRDAVVALAAALPVVVSATGAAVADAPVTCPPGSEFEPKAGVCVIAVTTPGAGGSAGGATSGGGNPQPASKPACSYILGGGAREVPCSGEYGWWSQSEQAYCKAAAPQPPAGDPAWGGHTDGQIYECTRPAGAMPAVGVGGIGVVFLVWLARPPAGAPPDPRVLAQRAVAAMNLRAVSIGIVPEARAGSVGLVGMPVWMWDANPGPSSWGPLTKSVSAGGYTVTATAKVSKAVWSMGDSHVVVCRGPGTPYRDAFGKRPSPDCGYTYVRQGVYRVWVRSYWTVDWSGVGQSGSIPLQFADSARITIGEAQVLTQ